jgi:hypothetical protein
MLNGVAWSKVGSLDDLGVVLVDVDTRGRHLRDLNSADHPQDRASKEVSADGEALEIEVGSEVDSTIEVEEGSEVVAGLAATVVGLVVIEVGLAGEEALAIKIAVASQMAPHLLVLRVDLGPEVVLDQAHQMAAADTKIEDATVTAATDEEVAVVGEVAMTPEILVVLVAAIETLLATAEVGTATVIDMPTDPDETKTTDRESDTTRVTSTMTRDRSGGIEHHIPVQVCWWVSLFNSFDFCLVSFLIRGKKVLHYYHIERLSKASAKALWWVLAIGLRA